MNDRKEMLKIGLTSVSFRNLDSTQIIEYCDKCGISTIEWGSDIHLPVRNIKKAQMIRNACDTFNIKASSYGSYYWCGTNENIEVAFQDYIDTAKILGANTIRIWVGKYDYENAEQSYIKNVIEELKIICLMAQKENIDIGCEFHRGTLCNSRDNALDIVEKVQFENFGMYFQYDPFLSINENIEVLKSFIPVLKNVHVFFITQDGNRISLSDKDAEKIWHNYIEMLLANNVKTNLLFEFLPDASLEGLSREVQALNNILENFK